MSKCEKNRSELLYHSVLCHTLYQPGCTIQPGLEELLMKISSSHSHSCLYTFTCHTAVGKRLNPCRDGVSSTLVHISTTHFHSLARIQVA